MSSFFTILLFAVLFFFSGIVVNVFHFLSLLFVWPFSKRIYRITNGLIADAFWSQMVWLVEWRAGVKLRLFTDEATWKVLGTEHCLLISNHRSDVDWLIGWVVAKRMKCLGGAKALMKRSLIFLPLIGWSMWFLEFVSLRRNWAKDEATLKAAYNRLRDYPRPFWMVLFVEGTRFTEAKLLAAQEYARANGLQVPKHVLIPKTKGFVSAVQHMRTFVPALYDFTVAVPKTSESPTMSSLLNGKSAEVHLHVRRYNLNDLPKEDGEIANFCRKVFMEKITMGWMSLMALWFLAMGIWALMAGALTGKTIGMVIAIPVILGLLLKAMMLSTRADLSSSNRRAKRQQQAIVQQGGMGEETGNVREGGENHVHAE